MKFLKILFFLCSIANLVHGGNVQTATCPNYSCSSSSPPQNTCTYRNLSCQDHETPVVTLPYAGEFYVRNISYDGDTNSPFIQLYDPENCLLGRLMHILNLSSSPYKAISYENYTYYFCPSDSETSYYPNPPIKCLSNSTTVAVATTTLFSPPFMMESGCKVIGSWQLPVLEPQQFETEGLNVDLYLTWNLSTCEDCQETQDQLIEEPVYVENEDTSARYTAINSASKHKYKERLRKLASVLHNPSACAALAIMFVFCLLSIIKCLHKTETEDHIVNNALPENFSNEIGAQTHPAFTGLGVSEINVCTELAVVGRSRITPGPDSDATCCSICLDSYVGGEMVRSMPNCGHCFHAYCIELWLRRNITCPVCRTIVAVAVADF